MKAMSKLVMKTIFMTTFPLPNSPPLPCQYICVLNWLFTGINIVKNSEPLPLKKSAPEPRDDADMQRLYFASCAGEDKSWPARRPTVKVFPSHHAQSNCRL